MPDIRKKTVLIVDNNQDAADVLALLVQDRGHTAHVLYNSEHSVAKALELHPDIIIHDIGMPVVDGYMAAKAIRAQPALRDTMLIALTGYGTEGDRAMALLSGFDLHVNKPLELERLDELLAVGDKTTLRAALTGKKT